MSAAFSTALPPARRPVVARRIVVVLLALLVGVAALAVAPPPASANTTTSRLYSPAARTVNAGALTTVRSKLVSGEGRPMVGHTVTLQGKRPGGVWRYLATDTSGSYGVVAVRVRFSKSMYIRFRYAGNTVYAGTYSGSALVRVRPLGEAAIVEAARHRGKPYGYGAAGPSRFDCSGYTSYVYGRLGRSLPHSSGAQRDRTRQIAKSSRRVGDLVFFHGSGGIYHVGIYAGNGYMWDSPRAGKLVSKRPIYSSNVSYGRVS